MSLQGTARGVRESGWRRSRLVAALAITGMLLTGTIATGSAEPAYAAGYPSWEDVKKAKANVAAKAAEKQRIETLIAQLQADVERTQQEAIEKGKKFYEAELAHDTAAFKAEQLQKQADDAKVRAEESMRQAGQMAARQSRTGGGDLSSRLFFNGDDARDLLSQLGMAAKIAEQSNGLYAKAQQDQNNAQALTDQANVAKDALKVLAEAAEQAFAEAQEAAIAAEAALAAQEAHVQTLQAQLAALEDTANRTVEQYQEGEAIRKAEEERRRRAAEEAAAGSGGQVGSGGWARPSGGGISSHYGMRTNPVTGVYTLHAGTDLGAGCATGIFAASGGTVTYAGWNYGYGYFVRVDHGGGVTTSYAHIMEGGIGVSHGQRVSAGQFIARVGSTGNSTGCHLHFETRVSGNPYNPVYFMADRGVTL
ncbi:MULTISPECIES: M23 family metallopeptidase [unclassified Cryobacterium]|uniref:M23 family metallopeptidase n=1 Tax=unclassified Cryobacterium TaxID=2649013 RepID=UPI001D0BF126|nr:MULTISPECIES: M23 family metallopeptidase [unclassified Cryobacterium]